MTEVCATSVYVLICKTRQINLKKDNRTIPLVVETIINVAISTSVIAVEFVILIIQRIMIVIPFIFLIIVFSFINSNSDGVLKGILETYNNFIIKTNLLEYIRKGSWIMKILFETLSPVYNYMIDNISGGLMEILSLLIDDETNRKNLISMVSEFGNLFVTVGVAISRWMNVNFQECKFDNVIVVL